ncbi:MAG: hypothetical protein WD069_17410 [Planctomycetales bacterium]
MKVVERADATGTLAEYAADIQSGPVIVTQCGRRGGRGWSNAKPRCARFARLADDLHRQLSSDAFVRRFLERPISFDRPFAS